ncbi:MAG: CheY-like chemotaxis protein [Verrucomicrobiales bacterium]|jgi:CheY-like chemotaxis protein
MNGVPGHMNTILIVEDLKTDARLIERSMKQARIISQMDFVADGQQAIDYLSGQEDYSDQKGQKQPVLILLDLKLPKRDGFEVLHWIKQQPALKEIPVVVLTSSSLSPDVTRARSLGADSYLVKPVEDDALIEMFRKMGVYKLVMNAHPGVTDND